jgi:photosystem II stability/assembly factor-like uncharacterized protein
MSDEERVILSTATSLFLQFEPGKEVYYLGQCTSLPEIPNPKGGFDPIPCRDGHGGFEIIGEKPSPPDLISFSLERLHTRTASWIDKANCPFTVFAVQRCEGNEGIFANWITGQVVHKAHLVDDTISNVSQRDAADEIMRAYDVIARPPRVDLWEMLSSQKSTTEVQDANCITSPLYSTCGDGCDQQILDPCQKFFVGTDNFAGASANVLYSSDQGQTWAATAADPFAINLNITAIKAFMLDSRTVRVIAFRMTLAGVALAAARSDDLGATWTAETVGATIAEAVNSPNAFHIFDADQMWVGTSTGRIYKSVDGGDTWDEQTSALVASGGSQINGIDFLNSKFGVAVGAADQVIYTVDGGVNWADATATGDGGVLNDVEVHSRSRWSVATATGDHYMTYDGGVTWTQLNGFSGAAAGSVKGFSFPEGAEMNGFMIHQTAGTIGRIFRTIDGGNSWILVNPVTGVAGLNEVLACNLNHAFAVGDDDATRAVIIEAGIL